MKNAEAIQYTKSISLILIALSLLLLPLFFLTNTTDFFIFPKQVLMVGITLVLLILWGVRSYFERKIVLRTSPFNLPVFIFGAVVLVSSLIAPNRFDSLLQAVPLIFSLLFYFTVINTIDNRNAFNVALSSLMIGAVLSSIVSLFYFFNIYIFPFQSIQSQYFTTFGSPVQHIAYLIPVLLLSGLYVWKRYKAGSFKEFGRDYNLVIHVVSSIVVILGIALTIYKVAALPQKPIVLPFTYGFQIALASIAQDTGRMLLSFLFGSGYGTYLVDFTRFQPVAFNLEENLWNLSFSFSSSYVLELISTAGVLGVLAFLFIFFRTLRTRTNPMSPLFIAVIATFVLSALIPYSYVLVTLLFTLLAFYCVFLFLEGDKRVDDVVISLVTFKQGLLAFESEADASRNRARTEGLAFPLVAIALILVLTGFVGYFTTRLLLSDVTFAKSLQQDSLTSGQQTYDLQRASMDPNSISGFPYKSDYYRIFSQVNLALANSLVTNLQGASPSAQQQQTILALLQQSINSARAAATLSPMTPANWENLSQVYRSLIGVGQNSEQFAIASLQQAIRLYPYNPRLYIAMGGVFYQLGAYDQAINQFQIAASVKRDYANAYYNLGHAYEAKEDYQNALTNYQIVRQLVANDPNGVKQIDDEIAALQGKAEAQPGASDVKPADNQDPLELDQPAQQFPERPADEQIELSPPPTDNEASESAR
jgi:tetratricopeptide (TPR) repeat protein